VTGIVAHGCATAFRVSKDQPLTLPRMGATDAHIIRIAGGDIPPSRHVYRLPAILNKRAIVNFVKVQRRV
jgi:hypothetical protein